MKNPSNILARTRLLKTSHVAEYDSAETEEKSIEIPNFRKIPRISKNIWRAINRTLLARICLYVYLQYGYFSKIPKRHLQDSTDLILAKVTEKEKETNNSLNQKTLSLTINSYYRKSKKRSKQRKNKTKQTQKFIGILIYRWYHLT